MVIRSRRLRYIVEEERSRVHAADLAAARDGRPRTRAECARISRPCPFVGCRFHLALEVGKGGSLIFPWGDTPLENLPDTCALDVADRGGVSLESVGRVLNVTRQRVQQVEEHALQRCNGWMDELR